MKLSLREKLMVCVLVWAVGGYLFYAYAYHPVKGEAAAWKEKNTELREQVEAARQIDKELKNMEDKQLQYRNKYTKLARQLPSQKYVPEVVAFAEDTAEESGVNLLKFNYQQQDKKSADDKKSDSAAGIDNLDMNLTGSGSYYDLVTFIRSLEEASRLYNLSEINMLANSVKQAVPVQMSEEGPVFAPAPELKGSASYDPNNIELSIKFQAYYDGKTSKGIADVENPVEPVTSNRDNPFTP